MQIKTVMRYHFTSVREWPQPRPLTTPPADEDAEQKKLSFIAAGNAKSYSYFETQFGGFLQD